MVYQHKLQEFFIISTVLKKKLIQEVVDIEGSSEIWEPVALIATHECRI